MSAQSTPDASPITVQPLHHPEQAAQQPPLGNATNLADAPGMGGKALLAKKMAGGKKAYVSPSDAIMTPCTAKLSKAKNKHFSKGKPIRFAFNKATPEEDESEVAQAQNSSPLAQTKEDESDDEDKMDVEDAPAPALTSRLEPAEF
ncbi:hypothetical protein EXIGLDRAFT_715817 [Exidia glandulosa HHB12029]|uniref:Uncharacterized protein n=1 Tax=Exidia glandulosa HHB12029 TaxID=1314781 RepID=A0A165QKP2_EXIGL|nr:hypothetical protein EXIGLDRAFT_715817 [Exidia glandulosa HHB12029]